MDVEFRQASTIKLEKLQLRWYLLFFMREENSAVEDTKYPEDFMAFTTFNPRAFEHVWRKWQPKGNLVFAELPPEAQNTLLDELSKSVKFELGWHYLNGEFGSDDDHLFQRYPDPGG